MKTGYNSEKRATPITFELGKTYATSGALKALTHEERSALFIRHSEGDWGDIDQDDWAENELSLKENFRLFSAYKVRPNLEVWIITESDRSSTTMLLPEEY